MVLPLNKVVNLFRRGFHLALTYRVLIHSASFAFFSIPYNQQWHHLNQMVCKLRIHIVMRSEYNGLGSFLNLCSANGLRFQFGALLLSTELNTNCVEWKFMHKICFEDSVYTQNVYYGFNAVASTMRHLIKCVENNAREICFTTNKNTHCFEWKSKVCAKFVGFRGLTRWIEITWFRIPVNNIVTDKQLHLVRCWEHRKIMRTKQHFFTFFFYNEIRENNRAKKTGQKNDEDGEERERELMKREIITKLFNYTLNVMESLGNQSTYEIWRFVQHICFVTNRSTKSQKPCSNNSLIFQFSITMYACF